MKHIFRSIVFYFVLSFILNDTVDGFENNKKTSKHFLKFKSGTKSNDY